MGEVIKVGMADLKTAKAPNTLTTLGLGSCIGLTLYDPVTIAGGACMFEMSGLSSVGNVGARNAEEAKIILKELRIPLIAEDTGLNYGRTVELDCETGDFRIKSVGKEIKVI